ncbi:hypothetical conserved protein [Oceanobacillus iheyensis HTE831]|uniref:Hypothetical conserved protein n=1 Tax=Oceanobacillus iheyensis (strain DSM 14371 / CIP 107618 / JCM 11309 / KCTC 3954 / HTE831) TaxID=221109 RepID=Q8ETC1_OCEIH|nr:divalent cation tolerance protein CutA [Oceanobacillus iheyensis]BAC12296.1 hypothetical conserved protein [Oceanobacillus iheyensis HTE831]
MNVDYVKVEVYLPEEYIETMRNELNDHGFLTVGNYDHVISYSRVKGFWRPLEFASSFDGEKGKISHGTECKMEFSCMRDQVEQVRKIIIDNHPYEEPIIYFIPILI